MVGLSSPLAMFSHQKSSPSKSKSKSKTPNRTTKQEGNDDDDPETPAENPAEVGSQFSSSCEIFNLFKVLAAGKKDRQPFHAEVDSDESEDEPQPQIQRPSSAAQTHDQADTSLKHVLSARTVRQSDTLHDDDGEEPEAGLEADVDDRDTLVEGGMDKEETLRRWQESFGSSTAELDAQGSKLAGRRLLVVPIPGA